MAHRLIGGNQPFLQTGADWSATGAREAGRNTRAPFGQVRFSGNLLFDGRKTLVEQLEQNWSKTGADWSSKGASAPVVFPPLKGGNNHNWSSAPVRLQNWSGECGA